MFSEYLKKHPIRRLDPKKMDDLYPPAENREAWEGISDADKQQLSALFAQYEPLLYPIRTATGFMAFARTGSRQADEAPYFLRRRKLCAAVLNCCLYPDAPLDDVIDGVWCICEESTWVISAHNINPIPGAPAAEQYPLPRMDGYIDLFSAQTGMILALTSHLLHERLSAEVPQLLSKIHASVYHRIILPMAQENDFWWTGTIRKDLNNWTPWIVSNLLVCFCLFPFIDQEERVLFLTSACQMLDRWLQCVPEDGGCDEGAGYWNMAGGALVDCLEILETVSGGRLKFWKEEKIRNILAFPLKAEIGNGWFMNFADCDARPFISGERLQLAGEKLNVPVLTALGLRMRGTLADQINDTPHLTRVLRMLFHPARGCEATPLQEKDIWLPNLQVRVLNKGRLTLCCKGGNNGESHNHNDVGSFMLYVDGEPQIVDAGNAVYTAKTFSSQRYTLWHTRSAYHNLPIIGGAEQRAGSQYKCGYIRYLPEGLRVGFAKAYGPEADAKQVSREYSLSECGLFIFDHIVLLKPHPVTWVFLLRHEPRIEPGQAISGAIRLTFSKEMTAMAEEIPIDDPRMARNFPGSLWRLTVSAPKALKHSAVFSVNIV